MGRIDEDGGEHGMRYNGVNPSEISPKIFVSHEAISPIPPRSVRLVASSIQSYLAGVDLSPREIHLHLNFAGRSHSNANALAAKVAALFCREDLAEYEPTHMPGKAMSAILQSATEPEWHWGFGVIEYIFVAPRPFLHSTSETVVTGGRQVYMEPRGSVPAQPVITHKMAAAAATLTIGISDGQTSQTVMVIRNPLGNALPAGLVVSVDFASRLCSINGIAANEYIDYTVSDWHPDIRGGTLITLSDGGETTVRWRDEWM